MSVMQVDDAVWRSALALAEGDARRIEVVDEHTVVVRNRRVR